MSNLDISYKYLNNIEYRKIPHEGILKGLFDNKILVIHGQGDDILDIYGFKNESFQAMRGFSYKDYEDCQREEFKVLKELEVEMIWCPDKERSWLVKANNKYEKREFNVFKKGKIFCTGLIIDLSRRNSK